MPGLSTRNREKAPCSHRLGQPPAHPNSSFGDCAWMTGKPETILRTVPYDAPTGAAPKGGVRHHDDYKFQVGAEIMQGMTVVTVSSHPRMLTENATWIR